MLPPHLCLPALAFTLATAFVPSQALAQTYRPDAEGYPCASKGMLAVFQDGPDFVIRKTRAPERARTETPTQAEADAATKALVKIGATLKLDQQIFKAALRRSQEAADASRR